MKFENSLTRAYTIGTQREIDNYKQQDPFKRGSYLAYAFWLEFGAMSLTQFLPENIDHYFFAPLVADVSFRWGAGVINSVRNYVSAKKSNNPIKFLDAIVSIPQRPGIIGRVRGLTKKRNNRVKFT